MLNRLVFVALIAVWLMALCALALAHGDAGWIQKNPNYRMRTSNAHCCDPSHCRKVPAGFATRVRSGWKVETGEVFEDDRQGLYDSIDGDVWACGSSETTWCLFVAPPGV